MKLLAVLAVPEGCASVAHVTPHMTRPHAPLITRMTLRTALYLDHLIMLVKSEDENNGTLLENLYG